MTIINSVIIKKSGAKWIRGFQSGKGEMEIINKFNIGSFSMKSRFNDGPGISPDELLAASHAGCFSMSLANALELKGFCPDYIETEASVYLEEDKRGFSIAKVELVTTGRVKGISENEFVEIAKCSKKESIISRALCVEIGLRAVLENKEPSLA